MNRSRDRQSRFGPPNYNPPNSVAPIRSTFDGIPRNSNNDKNYQQNSGSSMFNRFKTPEQLAFDNEFKKWEKSFEDWKRAYANHPDRNAYREYENKFLNVREKLIEKRKQIYSIERTGVDESFDNYLNAADAMANSILSKFSDTNSQKDFRNDDQYRGGYSRGNRDEMYGPTDGGFDRGYGSYDRGFGSNNRGFGSNDCGFGPNDRGFGSNDCGFGSNDRSHGFNERGGNNRDFGGSSCRENQREGRDRLGFDNKKDNRRGSFGQNDRNYRGGRDFGRRSDQFQRMRKPTEEQINKDLRRRDVYPHNRWQLISKEGRPPLVGKRAKKVNKKIQKVIEKKQQISLENLPFSEKVDKMFELAQQAECPKLLPGSAKRRLINIKKKNDSDVTSDERKFMAYCEYVSVKRVKYFEEKKKREEEAKAKDDQQSTPMDDHQSTTVNENSSET